MLQAVSLRGRGWMASVLAACALGLGAASAQASGVVWSVGVHTPVVTVGAGSGYPVGHGVAAPMYRAPVYVHPAHVHRPPVYVQPGQVVHPAPVYVQPGQVVVAPPAVAYSYGHAVQPVYGYGHRHPHHHPHHRPHPHWGNWDRY